MSDSCKNRDLFPFWEAEKEKVVKFLDKQKSRPIPKYSLMS